ncbi:MAG: hypothetical protein QNJ09_10495 [Paracoccaceae bacterium]|nr:hypothetical protein [Paracoccaceae bacterium]
MSGAAVDDLPAVWTGIEIKWSADWPPEPKAIATATKLLTALSGAAPMPASATRGYWPTVSLKWPALGVEVEALATHCELYHFCDGELVGEEIPSFKATKSGITPLLAALSGGD